VQVNKQLKLVLEIVLVPIAAAIVFVEQVLIRYLNRMMAAFARLTWVAKLEAWLVTLPPWAAVLTFVTPSILILPVKLSTLWFVAHHRFVLAFLALALGKILATAIVARLYRILRPTLRQLGWFAWADTKFFLWRDWAYAYVRSLPAWQKAKVAIERARLWLATLLSGLFAR
jgi:hypothetical protein